MYILAQIIEVRISEILLYLIDVCTVQELVRELGDGAFSGTLAADSSNVVTLVRDLYNVRPNVTHKI